MLKSKYSKTEVRKAGQNLRNYINGEIEFSDRIVESYNILVNWREIHAYPMKAMLSNFRNHTLKIDEHGIIVQRLKRRLSIVNKLKENSSMKLDRMNDIAGCRIIVANVSLVYKIYKSLKRSRSKHTINNEKDYITTPKESGYRSIHLIYKYNGGNNLYKGLNVELQIRSKVQHSWATAVEVVGTFKKQALKASKGEQKWKDFFKLSSVAFSDLENGLLKENAETEDRQYLKVISRDLNIFNILELVTISIENITNKKNNEYFLMILHVDKSKIEFKGFNKDEFIKATDLYVEYEKEYEKEKNTDVVLVSAESIEDLKKAYPNYFADTKLFAANLKLVLTAKPNIIHDSLIRR